MSHWHDLLMLNTLHAPVGNMRIFIHIRIRILHVVQSADPHFTPIHCNPNVPSLPVFRRELKTVLFRSSFPDANWQCSTVLYLRTRCSVLICHHVLVATNRFCWHCTVVLQQQCDNAIIILLLLLLLLHERGELADVNLIAKTFQINNCHSLSLQHNQKSCLSVFACLSVC